MSKAAQKRLMDQADRAAASFAFFSPASEKDDRVAARMAAVGSLVRVCSRIYARPSDWEELRPNVRHLWLARAQQDRHPTWVFCGITAALIHGLSVSYSQIDRPMLAVGPHGHTERTETVQRVETSTSDAVVVNGLKTTPLLQTVFDCMRWMSFEEGLVVADSAIRTGLAEKGQLIDYVLSQNGGVKGISKAYVCALHADGRAENGGESLSRAVMLELGFACPELQVEIPNPVNSGHLYRLDFAWKLPNGQLLGGEHDGFEKYTNEDMLSGGTTLDSLVAERQRESRIASLGIRVLRFTARQRSDREHMWRLLSAYGVPWIGVPQEISSPRAAAHMLAKARQKRRDEQWIHERIQSACQMQLGSYLVTVEVIQGPWHRRASRRQANRAQANGATVTAPLSDGADTATPPLSVATQTTGATQLPVTVEKDLDT